MSMRILMLTLLGPVVLASLATLGCRNEDQAGAEALWDDLQAADYRSWARAPGFPGRTPSTASHGDEVDIFINDVLVDALAGGPLTAWPDGSIIVKDGHRDGVNYLVAAMEKRGDGWYWAEYEDDGAVIFSGTPGICLRCHDAGDDYVRAFKLPQ